MQTSPLREPISDHIWSTQYRWVENAHIQEPDVGATWDRVALAVSGPEKHNRDAWRERFRNILEDFRFLPGSCMLANAGTTRRAALIDCFAAAPIEDSIQGIFNSLRETMLNVQAGSSVAIDFSTLRPAGSRALASDSLASGPVSFLKLWEEAHMILDSSNLRRSSLAANLRCDHPDIEAFIDSQLDRGALPHFKFSVAITDSFMQAVEKDGPWPLVFPLGEHPIQPGEEVCERFSTDGTPPQLCRVHRRIPARALWDKLLEAQHASGAPGVLFIDRMNRANNLWYCEHISCANPYGEMPLPANAGAALGSINLSRFVEHPFEKHAHVDLAGIKVTAAIATRFLDNALDLTVFPHKPQQKAAQSSRRIGLGICGLADLLAMVGVRYGSNSSRDLTNEIMAIVRDTAYRTSIEIAQEKGVFPEFDKIKYGASPFILNLPHDIQNAIARNGIRNSNLLTVSRNESACLLGNNVSRGIEPINALKAKRRVLGANGKAVTIEVCDPAWQRYVQTHESNASPARLWFEAVDVSPQDQLQLQSAVQNWVDGAITNTVHCPKNATPQELGLVVLQAWELGLKGCLAQREVHAAEGAVIETATLPMELQLPVF